MDIKSVLQRQYTACLDMLQEVIDKCPEDLWASGKPPRQFWRVTYHALYYTHLYVSESSETFTAWDRHVDHVSSLWSYAKLKTFYSREELLEYLADCRAQTARGVEAMDLEAEDCGFSYYNLPKLDHQFVNLRHVQHHIGQLSDRLLQAGIETSWIGGSRGKRRSRKRSDPATT